MKNQALHILSSLMLCTVCISAQAATWQVCNLELHVTESKINPPPVLNGNPGVPLGGKGAQHNATFNLLIYK